MSFHLSCKRPLKLRALPFFANSITNGIYSNFRIFCFTVPFKHCQEAYTQGSRFTGVYPIHVDGTMFFDAPCDMKTDGGGWIVFQRRVDASVDFYRNWDDYKSGFGDLTGNFWLGLEKIHKLAGPGKGSILRVDLKHVSNASHLIFAEYTTFEISDEGTGYKLTVGGHSGNAGDSLSRQNGKKFSTKDKDQDTWYENCAVACEGAWWYSDCYDSHLNGVFPATASDTDPKYIGWRKYRNQFAGITFSEMKIRYLNP